MGAGHGNPQIKPHWSDIIVEGDVIKDGTNYQVVTVEWSSKESYSAEVENAILLDSSLVIAYCYCSVYDECRYVDSRNDIGMDWEPLMKCN